MPEERGRVWGGGGKNKALKALKKMPLNLKASPGGLGKREPKRRSQLTLTGKEQKTRRLEDEGRKQRTMKDWIKRNAEGPEDPPPDLKDVGTGSLEERTNLK